MMESDIFTKAISLIYPERLSRVVPAEEVTKTFNWIVMYNQIYSKLQTKVSPIHLNPPLIVTEVITLYENSEEEYRERLRGYFRGSFK